jgi:predicted RNA-binding protein with PIN domain
MGLALALYEKLTEAPDDATRFRLIVDTIDALEQQRPSGSDIALRADVRESELRLQREIAELRAEVQKDIAELQKAMGELRADVDRDVAQLQASIERTKTDLLKWIVPLMLGQVGALAALVKLL